MSQFYRNLLTATFPPKFAFLLSCSACFKAIKNSHQIRPQFHTGQNYSFSGKIKGGVEQSSLSFRVIKCILVLFVEATVSGNLESTNLLE